MSIRRTAARLALLLAGACFPATACGDVHADLITGPDQLGTGGSGATNTGGAAGTGSGGSDASTGHLCATVSDCNTDPRTPHCDRATGRCVECLGVGFTPHCPAGKTCIQPSSTCVTACTTADACSSRVCNLATGLCGTCATDNDCPFSHKRCLEASGDCVECEDGRDCMSDERRICDGSNRCVECTGTVPGDCGLGGEECSTELGECAVPCERDDDCLEDPKCHPAFHFCVQCLEPADCGGAPCVKWECGP